MNFYAEYPFESGSGGGGGGITSINAQTGPAITIAAGTGINVSSAANTVTISSTSSGGTVTSVALADGSSTPIYTISGSPVTTSGTLTFTFNTQSPNTFLAGPTSGPVAQPTFRVITNSDLSSITTLASLSLPGAQVTGNISGNSGNVTGIVAVANGGTGDSSFTAYSPIVGGTTSTGALQSVSNGGATVGQVLTYQGTGSLPTWTTSSGSGLSEAQVWARVAYGM